MSPVMHNFVEYPMLNLSFHEILIALYFYDVIVGLEE